MPTSYRLRTAILTGLVAFTAATAGAHDFWLEPSKFNPAVGEDVSVRLLVGDYFVGKPFSRNPQHIERFVVVGPSDTRAVKGRTGQDPAGAFHIATEGTYVLGYRSTRSRIELEAKKFEDYLRHEGLDTVLAERKKRKETERAWTELFSRCAKSIVRAGTKGDEKGYGRALGLVLELIPETAPHTLAPGREMVLRLVRDGKPVAGSTVTGHDTPGSSDVVSAKTDAAGRVRLKFPRAGTWMVNTVQMTRTTAAVAEELDADWESLWASLTFEVPKAPSVPVPVPAR